MRIIDVDAHFHEPVDWIEHTDPELAKAARPAAALHRCRRCGFRHQQPGAVAAAGGAATRYGLGHRAAGLRATSGDDRHSPTGERQSALAGDPFCDPVARLKVCDAEGIDVQFLNPSFLVDPIVQAARARRRRPDAAHPPDAGIAGRWTWCTGTPTV